MLNAKVIGVVAHHHTVFFSAKQTTQQNTDTGDDIKTFICYQSLLNHLLLLNVLFFIRI